MRCVFLGPGSVTGAEAAASEEGSAPRPPVGRLEEVRFRWSISVPDAPAEFVQDEVVVARAGHVLDRGIPAPPGWGTLLKLRARVLRAVEDAGQGSRDYEVVVRGVFRAPALASPSQPPAPRTGAKWTIREAGGVVEVWVAGHHAADEWWCVKARRKIVHFAPLAASAPCRRGCAHLQRAV